MANRLIMGNEAFAHAALAAGVRVVAGYPGTPSSEVIETIALEHSLGHAKGIHVEWSTNEKVALELLAGASYAGARTLFTCKQVGLNVASDALMSLNYVGIKGGMVLFVADDPGPISSQTEQDTRRFAEFAKVPVFDPATVEQGYEMMVAAFNLSETYQTPVIVRATTRVCHASTFMNIAEYTVAQEASGFERSPRWVIFPKRAYEAHGEINDRLHSIAEDFCQKPLKRFNPITIRESSPENLTTEKPRLGIVGGGVSVSYIQEALRLIELDVVGTEVIVPSYSFIQVGTPYPFPEERLVDFMIGKDQVLVIEELDSVLEDSLFKVLGKTSRSCEILGKASRHIKARGENTVDEIKEALIDFFGLDDLKTNNTESFSESALKKTPEDGASVAGELQIPALPIRPPVLCAGCPHRGSFYAIKRALKKLKQEAVYCGDIGCYTLGNAKPLDAIDTCLCMGAGITMAQGFSVVEPDKRHIAFVGDSTFFASGLPGIVNAVYNRHPITVVVLDNATTAMTGAQPHPGTGKTLMGTESPPLSIEAVLRAVGFNYIVRANPFSHDESVKVAIEAVSLNEPSAILFEAPCINLVKPDLPLSVNVETCTGCKRCITEIGCPAIEFNLGQGHAVIRSTLCTGCGLCITTCSFDAIGLAKRQAADRRDGGNDV